MANEMQLVVLDAEGWGQIVNNNFQKLNNQIDTIMDSSKSISTGTNYVAPLSDVVSAPAAINASAVTSASVSGTGDDATINSNFSALDTFTSQVVSDLNNLRNTIISNQNILTNLVSKVNSLRAEFTEGSGVAILKATP